MADNIYFKEVFDSEFSRLVATGISRQNAAAQALSSARNICNERLRCHQPIQLPSANLTGNATPLSDFDHRDSLELADRSNTIAPTASVISTPSSIEIPGQVQDRRKGKLAANVYSMSKKRIPSLTPLLSSAILPLNCDDLKRLLVECGHMGDYSPVIRLVGATFSSAEAMNKSFNLPDIDSSSICSNHLNSSSIFAGKAVVTDVEKDLGMHVKDEDNLTHLDNTKNIVKEGITKTSLVTLSSSVETASTTKHAVGHHNNNFDRISIDIDRVSDVFRMLFSTSHEGSVI